MVAGDRNISYLLKHITLYCSLVLHVDAFNSPAGRGFVLIRKINRSFALAGLQTIRRHDLNHLP